MIYEFFRLFGTITGIPAELLFFKRKTYYEDKAVQSRRIKGGALIIANHYNVLDYVMNAFVVFPRKLNVVASEHAYKNKLQAFGMRFWGGIQANRVTRSMRFMDIAADVIRKEQLVLIFPEGKNTDDGTIKQFYHSYLVIAHRARSPIIPIVSDGNYGIFKRASIIIGKPIDISQFNFSERPTRDELKAANEVIYNKVLSLREQLEILKSKKKKQTPKG